MPGREFINILKGCIRAYGTPESKNLGHAFVVQLFFNFGDGEQAFNFGTERKRMLGFPIKQRSYSDPIAGKEDAFVFFVPDTKSKLSVEHLQAFFAIQGI